MRNDIPRLHHHAPVSAARQWHRADNAHRQTTCRHSGHSGNCTVECHQLRRTIFDALIKKINKRRGCRVTLRSMNNPLRHSEYARSENEDTRSRRPFGASVEWSHRYGTVPFEFGSNNNRWGVIVIRTTNHTACYQIARNAQVTLLTVSTDKEAINKSIRWYEVDRHHVNGCAFKKPINNTEHCSWSKNVLQMCNSAAVTNVHVNDTNVLKLLKKYCAM